MTQNTAPYSARATSSLSSAASSHKTSPKRGLSAALHDAPGSDSMLLCRHMFLLSPLILISLGELVLFQGLTISPAPGEPHSTVLSAYAKSLF